MDEGIFRQALGRFATGVCVITTRAEGVDHAMTANTFTSVSLKPPLVLICVALEARFHDAVTAAGTWGVSVLNADAQEESRWFAVRGRPLHGQFDQVAHHRGQATGVALLDRSMSWLECRTTQIVPAGDHSVILGEVLCATVDDDADAGLVYYRSGYHRLC